MDDHGKRKFPYYSEVGSFEVKRPAYAAAAQQDHAHPRVYQERSFFDDGPKVCFGLALIDLDRRYSLLAGGQPLRCLEACTAYET